MKELTNIIEEIRLQFNKLYELSYLAFYYDIPKLDHRGKLYGLSTITFFFDSPYSEFCCYRLLEIKYDELNESYPIFISIFNYSNEIIQSLEINSQDELKMELYKLCENEIIKNEINKFLLESQSDEYI